MPAFVVPARSGAHRVAAIALYRALLTQCSPAAFPLADDQRIVLRNIIRNKFRRNRHVHSTRLLKLSFTAGYELLDMLARASSSPATATCSDDAKESATQLVANLLASAPPHLTRSPTDPNAQPRGPKRLDPSPEACPPPSARTLAIRPLPATALGGTGVRRVPRLVSANTFPMLRLQKPQPRSLSRVLTDKIKQRQRRLDVRSEAADYWSVLAQDEDEWDRLLWEREGVSPADGDDMIIDEWPEAEGSWTDEPQRVVRIISAQLGVQRTRTEWTVKKMQNIVDREAELAKVEREARKVRREVARMGKKRMKDMEAILGTDSPDRQGAKPL
ncbi:DNA repair protein [Lasiodiplodia theobromae]|uniref:Complex 1 LYR protein domain-containing protein n=1 Tax=Lasiodiplodia theobromae TaxID=45133 RepID=A0A5N5CZK4_9PEZI|nr:DNA repair protein [Lasiodiplodia theobromae]KAB2570766.1 hypothetical protein DBV05_g10589 [Lasiodiplodia theobromae]KAF4535156.1 DNA repair protein [Lasiodiplodia theobromae]